ncbi:MAG: N-acyl homoserine lactonase family protein [Microbacterium sp.]|uniref:N-acyl homoserine lactonase family protein n=1 Tax=Microbacterium sp. TaxID=51671 RepID=UPI002602DF09|nr:N-acyl homoserine lactonase family protein [Microbacterium sp.]MCX6503010.1 N-acyl homoserine lactonase family protein [Microbacterium sp.]
MGLKIIALPAGRVRGVPGSGVTFQRNADKTFDLAMMMFAITGGEHTVMVDTGTSDPDFVREQHGYTRFERAEAEEPLRVLADAGIDPAEVGTVIYTHLHWDHCSNPELFPNARFIVQKDELAFAMDPVPIFRKAFQRTATAQPPILSVLGQVETIQGRKVIAPGITAVPLPGHTPGSQGVLVETDAGKFLLAGDCIDRYENWEGDGATQSHLPSGSFINLIDYYESFEVIEQLGAEVIPGHDPRVLERRVFG